MIYNIKAWENQSRNIILIFKDKCQKRKDYYEKKIFWSLFITFLVFISETFLNFLVYPYPKILEDLIYFHALIVFLVAYASYGLGKKDKD